MAEAGTCMDINDVACHFGSHKTTAKRTINRFWQTGLAGDCPETRGPRAFYRSPDNQQQTVQSEKKTTRMTGFK